MDPKPLQVSKWIKIPFLVEGEEMEDLLRFLPAFTIYDVQKLTQKGEGIYKTNEFLECYRDYVALLKKGEIPPYAQFRTLFSGVWSVDPTALYELPVEERRLWKVCKPVVQCQINQVRYDSGQKKIVNQVYSKDSLSWGIQFGFPHLYLNEATLEIGKTDHFPNKALFAALQSWIRRSTLPTPFVIDGIKINSSIRLGKQCFRWINRHPQLKEQGLHVEERDGL